MFPIMFKSGQALLLGMARGLRPRHGRGLDAQCPRSSPASRPWPWPVRDRVQSAVSPCPRRDRDHVQSAAMSSPCPHPRPQSVPVRVRAANVRALPATANYPRPYPVRDRVQSAVSPRPRRARDCVQSVAISWPCPHPRPQSVPVRVWAANVRALSATANSPCPWPVRDRVESGKCPGRGRTVSALFPFPFQPLSAYVRL